jgi:hypothetical protein
MSAVFEAVGDVFEAVGDAVGDVVEGVFDVVETVMDEVVAPVMETVGNVVEAAMDDPLGTIAKVATAIYAPYLLPLTNAAVTLANGGDIGDALESAALTYVAQGVGQYVNSAADMAIGESFAPGSIQAITDPITGEVTNQIIKGSFADIAGNVIGGAASSAVRGGDPLDALLSGSIGAATNLLTKEIPGFSDLPPGVQQSVNSAISGTLQGGDPTNALLNAALNAGIAQVRDYNNESQLPEEVDVTTDSGITNRVYDSVTGMPTDDGLASLTTEASAKVDESGIPSLVDNGDGTFSQKMSDGSEIVKDEFGNLVDFKNPTEVAFEEQAEQSERDKLLGGKTQDEMTPQDWQAIYATPTTNPETGETVVGADPSMYNVQNLGIGDEVDFSFYDDPFSAWAANEDGTRTYTYDDGSTITADENGNVINVTETTDTPYVPKENSAAKSSAPKGVNINFPFGRNAIALGGAALGGAALLGELGEEDEQAAQQAQQKRLTMDWNQQGVNSLVNGAAYGQRFFDPTFTEVEAAKGGLMSLAAGGPTSSRYNLGSYSDGGRLLRGPGDGMSDNIPATIARKQPARLADGEFVIPADVVSHLGNGSTDAGSRVLYKMMEKVRRARTGNAKQGKKINPNKLVPR